MSKPWLTKEALEQIQKQAFESGLQDKREALLVGLPISVTDNLPTVESPKEQLVSDLESLNQERAYSSLIPIVTWLENAAVHLTAGSIRESFRRFANQIAVADHKQRHPFFDAVKFPLHLDEGRKFHRALSQAIQDPRDIQQWYQMAGADLRPLAPGNAEHVWGEALDNLVLARRLSRFCDLLLEEKRFKGIHDEVRRMIEATDDQDRDSTLRSAVGLESLPRDRGPLEASVGSQQADLKSIRGIAPDVLDLDVDTINEREIFTNDLLPIGFLSTAAAFGQSVCRLVVTRFENETPRVSQTGRKKRYFGTGWLIGSSHIVTNHHVINARDNHEPDASLADFALQAKSTVVQFDYDSENAEPEGRAVLELGHSNKELDYVILVLTEDSGRRPVALWPNEIDLSEDEALPVNIIQHPGGAPKQIGIRNNLVAKLTDHNLAYFTDTKGGSSGSPVCNDAWQVVALHKASTRTFGSFEFQGKTTEWVNIGTRIDRIITDLKSNQKELWEKIAANI